MLDLSESSAGGCRVADAELKKGPIEPSSRHRVAAFVPPARRRTDGASGFLAKSVTPRATRDCHHLASRSRPANISSHASSIRIGAPQIKIDLASPAEAGSGNGPRSVSLRAS